MRQSSDFASCVTKCCTGNVVSVVFDISLGATVCRLRLRHKRTYRSIGRQACLARNGTPTRGFTLIIICATLASKLVIERYDAPWLCHYMYINRQENLEGLTSQRTYHHLATSVVQHREHDQDSAELDRLSLWRSGYTHAYRTTPKHWRTQCISRPSVL